MNELRIVIDHSLIDIAAPTITFLSVIALIFQEPIRNFFSKAVLSAQINLQPPDCHFIELSDEKGNKISDVLYVRMIVKNEGRRSAKNCEVMLTKIVKIENNGNKTDERFLPMNLIWSHYQPRRINLNIRRGLFHHCDIGFIVGNKDKKAVLKIDTMVQPNKVSDGYYPNIIKWGKYEFTFIIGSDNTKTKEVKYMFEFDKFINDEKKMLNQLVVKII
ncbi:MAG: hypothetical protein WCJ86_03420 [Candidatus Saccharibacteria bacterium]